MSAAGSRGQASVEVVAAVPVLLLAALAAFQLLAVGYAGSLASAAAESGALALATGADPRAAARDAVPDWSRARMRVEVARGRVTVRMRPPSPLPALGRRLEVDSEAAVEDG